MSNNKFMFLFLLGYRVNYDFYDPGCKTVVDEQVENHPRNTDELKNVISNVLAGSENIDIFARKAQFGNVRKVAYNLVSTNYYNKKETQKILYRKFSLTTTFISSAKNSDGSFSVKHYKMTSTKELQLVFSNVHSVFIHPKVSTNYFAYTPSMMFMMGEISNLKGQEVAKYCDELISATNSQKAKIIEWFDSK